MYSESAGLLKKLKNVNHKCLNYSPHISKNDKIESTCDLSDKKVKLIIKNVTLKEDGQLFGCDTGNLSLFKLIVNGEYVFFFFL